MFLPSKLALLNYVVQIFFIRIAKNQERHITKFNIHSFDLVAPGRMASSGRIEGMKVMQWYSIIFPIVPFTGWINDFIYIGKHRSLKLTSAKEV